MGAPQSADSTDPASWAGRAGSADVYIWRGVTAAGAVAVMALGVAETIDLCGLRTMGVYDLSCADANRATGGYPKGGEDIAA
jgi:hypothetical protein